MKSCYVFQRNVVNIAKKNLLNGLMLFSILETAVDQ